MHYWYIEPRDPLIVRDGRPFGPDPGARARSIAFPTPSIIAGGVRNRAGLKGGVFDPGMISHVLQIEVRGPLLVVRHEDGKVEWLPPAPEDALLIGDEIVQLQPLQTAATDSSIDPDLALIGPRKVTFSKPNIHAPRFWYWKPFEEWLMNRNPLQGSCKVSDLGIAGLSSEWRTHVAIESDTQTARDGFLFQTSGLEFTSSNRSRLALVVGCSEAFAAFKGGLAPLGGERRLVAWRSGAPPFPTCPQALRDRIKQERACRVILLTPAYFSQGYRPTWLLGTVAGVKPTLKAALVQRSQVISGWDLQSGKPKPTRRLAPSGSVYFLKLPEDVDDAAIDAWIDALWMQNISDDAQSRRDGFGLAALGCWDGNPVNMEVLS